MQTSVDFSRHVKEVLNRNNIQIRSLEFVDPKVKEEFFAHRKKAILLIRNKVYEREINSLDNRTLDVFDTQLAPYLKKGQLALVVLPTGGRKRYVLQTKIDNIFVDRFRLIALDPRNTKRFSFSNPVGVKIRPVCDATVIRVQTGEVRTIRYHDGVLLDAPLDARSQTGNSTPDKGSEKNVPDGVDGKGGQPLASSPMEETGTPPCRGPQALIKDILFKDDDDVQADDFIKLAGQTPIDGAIVDISCGGMCVSHQPGAVESFFVDQLLTTECAFDKTSQPPAGSERLNLFVFAVVRNIKNDQGAAQLNLQFLATLPKAIQGYW